MKLKTISKPKKLILENLSISALKSTADNPRVHSKKQVRQIASSIKTFGFNSPLLIDKENTIICGHGRLLAAELLGLIEVPTIRIEHLSDQQKRAFMIADNKLTENAEWDESLLTVHFKELASAGLDFDLDITGFEIGEIDIIIANNVEENSEPLEDIVSVNAAAQVSKIGDMWLLGSHRVLCGDALNSSSYDLLMNSKSANLVFTDPPYNVQINGHVSGSGKVKHREFTMASGEMSNAEFSAFLLKTCDNLKTNSKEGSIHFICMDWRHAGELLITGQKVYTELKNLCVWVKDNGGMGSLYRSQHELVFVFKNGKASHRNNIELGKYGRYRTNVWNYPGGNTFNKKTDEGNVFALHPTVKPVTLIADAILDCSARGDIVLDCFLGSGSTLIAAEKTGRICYGLEIDPLYVDIIIRRWQKWTGNSAYNAETGIPFNEIEKSEVSNVR